MHILFVPITSENAKPVTQLQVAENQQGYIETVTECLAEAAENAAWHPEGIYINNILVGFIMYGSFMSRRTRKTRVWLDRLLIDIAYQGRGYGRVVILAILPMLFQKYNCTEVYLSVYSVNKPAIYLYQSLGFIYTGEKDSKGEDVMVLTKSVFIQNNLAIRQLQACEINDDFLQDFERKQIVTDCWRKNGDVWDVRPDPFIDDWTMQDRLLTSAFLRDAAAQGGFVVGAYIGQMLYGFASVGATLLGSQHQYAWLSELHTAAPYRGCGIGKLLFAQTKIFAKQKGAIKLYASTHSATETQRFYRGLGWVDAADPIEKLAAKEPFDCQLEYDLFI